MSYFIRVEQTASTYNGTIRIGKSANTLPLSNLALETDTIIAVKAHTFTLGDLVRTLLNSSGDVLGVFDERGQLAIGQYLYIQVFSQISNEDLPHVRKNENIQIYINAPDEHIARLPWNLLAHNGIFLCTIGWSVMLTSKTETIDCELPPSPRILIVAPQPFGVDQTRSTPHIDALEETLSLHDPLLSRQRNLRVVHTWEDFRQQLTDFAPQIVYYYGHGQGDEHTADLIFATGPNLAVKEVPVADFALALRNMETPPLLAYVNCCQGDAAGYLGVGKQLEDFIPAVITNRTKAQIDAAQAQAMALWESILLRGIPPHRSVADLYSRLGDLGLSLADLRWMTPVLHGHYGTWRANPPRPPGRLVHDPYWHLKIDRVTQFGTVATQSRQMLRERKPRSHVFVWYGRQGEGLEIFHHRLHIELREDLSNGHIYEVRPEWPMEFSNPGRSFHDMLVEAFGVRGLDDIPARIRSQTSGATGVQTLVYVRHLPVTSPKIMNPGLLKTYIEWWDSNFIPLLERNQYALLGVSFQVNNPPRFRKIVQEEDRLDELDLHDTVFRLLTEMENVARSDLLNFLRTHNIRLPLERRDQVLDQILEKTGGAYEQTVEELRNVVDMAWRIPEEETETPDPSEEIEYDY